MKKEKETNWGWRLLFYFAGMIALSLGLTMNTKAGLGTAPVLTIPLCVSNIWHIRFALLVFLLYAIFTILSYALRKDRDFRILLQFPFSIAFSFLLNFWSDTISFESTMIGWQLLMLLAAMVITAIGVSMMINMDLIANPADGFADTLGSLTGKGMGFGKNVLDVSCAVIAILISLAAVGHLEGVGIGTIISMIAVGRFISLFQHFARQPMMEKAGI